MERVPTRSAALRTATLIVAAVTALLSLAMASSAVAKEPTGAFKVFKQCPRSAPLEGKYCIYSETLSGEAKVGTTAVPIKNKVILQGGFIQKTTEEPEQFEAALNGETLSKTPQPVPGGLLGLVKCNEITGEGWAEKGARFACELVFQNALTGVNATLELAAPASTIKINTDNLVNEEGVALSIPVKVHLENPLLGSECYVGSNATPITLNLTTGTTTPPAPNKPIKGKVGNFEFREETIEAKKLNYIEITENTLVDNSFAAPVASGCGGIFAFLIDPLVNSKLGLPSASGKNTIIQNGTLKQATAETVVESEK
jgi:hypothetical protein